MKKILTYRGFTFSIFVLLNNRIEKRIDGDRFHLIKVHNKDNSVKFEQHINSSKNLGDYMMDLENQLKRDVDNELREVKTINESILEKMGYVSVQEN